MKTLLNLFRKKPETNADKEKYDLLYEKIFRIDRPELTPDEKRDAYRFNLLNRSCGSVKSNSISDTSSSYDAGMMYAMMSSFID